MAEVLLTEPAKLDMAEIKDYLLNKLFNPQAFENLRASVRNAFRVLETQPQAYPLCEDMRLKTLGYHKCVLGGYLFVYKVADDVRVYIVRFFHRSQNWKKLI